MHDDPFLRPDATEFGEIFADGLVVTLATQGLNSWSAAAIARWMKISPQAVAQRFGRARMLELTVSAYGRRWVAWCGRSSWAPDPGKGLPARLPHTEAERHGVRVWVLLGELAREEQLAGRQSLAARYSAAVESEHVQLVRALAGILGREPTPAEALETTALVSGLRHELVEERADPEQAEHALRAHVARLAEKSYPAA